MIRLILISSINFYRNYLSKMKLQSCRFYPTCSQYAVEVLEKYGALRGIPLVMMRLVRCSPFCKGGFDPA